MAYTRSNLGWSADQWQRLTKAVEEQAAQSRIVRPLLPIIRGSGYISGVTTQAVAPPAPAAGLPVHVAWPVIAAGPPRIHNPPAPQQLPVELSNEFLIPPEQYAEEDTVTWLATQAANYLAQAEDAVLLYGGVAGILGLIPPGVQARNLPGQVPLSPAAILPNFIGPPLAAVNIGIAALRFVNFTGPFHAIVDPLAYAAVYTPVPPATVGTAHQIAAVLHGGRLVDSPLLPVPNSGFIFSLAGRPIDLTVSVDLQVEVLNEERGALLRLVEQFCLRIKDQNAIVPLV